MLISSLCFKEHFLDVLCNRSLGKRFILLNLLCNLHVQRRNLDLTTFSSTLSILILSQILSKSFSLACFFLPHSYVVKFFLFAGSSLSSISSTLCSSAATYLSAPSSVLLPSTVSMLDQGTDIS